MSLAVADNELYVAFAVSSKFGGQLMSDFLNSENFGDLRFLEIGQKKALRDAVTR